MKNICKILFVLIGGFIGAGFASGQEILIFFINYKLGGLLGIIISSFLFSLIIYKVFLICKEYNIINYESFLYELNFLSKYKKTYIILFKIIVNAFLLSSFYIMIAGFASFFYMQFNIPILCTSSILCIICYFLFNKNIDSLIKISTFLIPLLVLFVCIIGIKQINLYNINLNLCIKNGWFISSLLYVSYNTILLIPLSINLKNYLPEKKDILYCFILIGIIIDFLSFILFFILYNYNFYNVDLPMLDVTGKINNTYRNIYSFIMLCAIITTLLSSGFTFIYNIKSKHFIRKLIIFLMCLSGIFISNFGFSKLINFLYPIFGYLGFLQIILILLKKC